MESVLDLELTRLRQMTAAEKVAVMDSLWRQAWSLKAAGRLAYVTTKSVLAVTPRANAASNRAARSRSSSCTSSFGLCM